MNKSPIIKRRVSFSSKNSVRLFKKDRKSKSCVPFDDSLVELSLNDVTDSLSSPESFTEEINSRSMNLCLATKQLLDFSPSIDYKSMDIEADNNSTKKLNRKSSILFPTENTTKIFFSPSTLEDLDISIDKGEKENQTFLVPSIEDLVEADLQCCDTIELENTADFLLADDSFDYFCKKSSKIESPEIQSLSPKTETISVSKFLSENGIQFCIFNRVPRKISLGYPSDSLTSLLSFAVDTDPSLSIEHIKLKKWILKKNLEQRFIFNTESEFLTDECSLEISEIENNLSFQNPKCFSCFNTQIGKRTSLKQLQRNCTLFSKNSWYLRLYEYHKKVNSLLTVLRFD